ncbi:hypothetical protein VKT23_001398 [Stygiomarasmius scandens]|uniref:Uncharacterized protein n=1 Tax=Marasmiellus scandens TaxID=2682957 RepID=A0ABR1JYS3_9AGAR
MSNNNLSPQNSEETSPSLNEAGANFIQHLQQCLRVYLSGVEQCQDPQGPSVNTSAASTADSQADIIQQIIERGFLDA